MTRLFDPVAFSYSQKVKFSPAYTNSVWLHLLRF